MKKNLVYLFSVLFVLTLITSCSKEDDKKPDVPEVSGSWGLTIEAPLYTNIDLGNPDLQKMVTPMIEMISKKITEDGSSLTLKFGEDNKFNVEIEDKDNKEVTLLPAFLALKYKQEGDIVYILMAKPTFEIGMGMLAKLGYGKEITEQIKAVFVEKELQRSFFVA